MGQTDNEKDSFFLNMINGQLLVTKKCFRLKQNYFQIVFVSIVGTRDRKTLTIILREERDELTLLLLDDLLLLVAGLGRVLFRTHPAHIQNRCLAVDISLVFNPPSRFSKNMFYVLFGIHERLF